MSILSVDKLVKDWFKGDDEGLTMSEASDDTPELVWNAILEILKHELTDDQKSLLAAGPLENLLAKHGSAFIERVEREAKVNAKLNDLLGGVWRQDMPDEIWRRIESVRRTAW